MPPVLVSAPGKVILCGEHAVVYGKKAIAAAVSLRSYLLCSPLQISERKIRIRFPDIDLDQSWNISELPWAAFQNSKRRNAYYDLVTEIDRPLLEAIQPHIESITAQATPEQIKVHRATATAFLYLMMCIGSSRIEPCTYVLRSTLPVSAGLGSSASMTVCIATALLLQFRALSVPHLEGPSSESEEQRRRINNWAYIGELLIHGNPSGVDNTISTYGGAVVFLRKDYNAPPKIVTMDQFPVLPLLLVDTLQRRSTSVECAKIAAMSTAHPKIVEGILEAIDAIVTAVSNILGNAAFSVHEESAMSSLGQLLELNHALLTVLGVSHPRLEQIKYAAYKTGIGWTKLTGAGGGGCALVLLRPKPTPESEISASHVSFDNHPPKSTLKGGLGDDGFKMFDVKLAGPGVGVLYPARTGEQEVDEEVFVRAEGTEGIEKFIAGQTGIWKYW